ncbi:MULTISPECIES: response regulator transcription factor [Sphingomonadales]|uniref:DNA-binding response regulator n=2 Tax=Edaphosphingomonas TaxID=3423724 RepID=A0A2T4HLM4_9SPHN|nr:MULTISPECIES: response regulator transcription factor [Sphingomonas]AGH49009.1 two component transcriptional regulator [Sphingomonas sp. MM-1]MDX3885324.1 response regulator transcription factor [Sphingomonas sp.]OHT21428.1 Transcriptional regulatory protein TcrA [Sphingomonas haloaromaticamans]PTD16711.1 DNA-binding response regulator [Sphingomonas fennica]
MDVLLVEDDAILAKDLAAELRECGHQAQIVGDGRLALQALVDRKFDAVILDRMLPELDGLSVLNRMRAEGMTLPVIMLTALGKSADKVEGLEQGADDYVVKPVDAAELNARLMAVSRGRQWNMPENDTISAGDITVSPLRHRAWYKGAPVVLPKVEFQLLAELVRNADRVLTRAMLYERVWDYDFEPKSNIADMYIRRLRLKLMEAGCDDPIVTVRGIGYMLRA